MDKKPIWTNFFGDLNMYQAKSGVISFSLGAEGGGVLGQQNKSCSEWSETWSGFGIFKIQ